MSPRRILTIVLSLLLLAILAESPHPPVLAGEASPQAVEPDPIVQMIIDQVNQETISQYNRQLAGEIPVWVDGDWYTITSRYTYSGESIQKATRYVGQRMADQGLDVEYHVWDDATNPNVIGEIAGLTTPQDIFIIGAHLDDVQDTPGADANASGSVATLLAAELLSQHDWGCTVRFAFWTGGEQGSLGSEAYAQRSADNGENIIGYLNLDTIAYNTLDSSPDIDLIYTSSMQTTRQLAQLMSDVIHAYNLDLVPQLRNKPNSASDHQSFWDEGYTAILAMEDEDDYNPYYHTPNDTPANTNLPYFTEVVKASLATFLHMSDCIIPSQAGTLEGTVTDAETSNPIPNTDIHIEDDQGYTFSAHTDDFGFYTHQLISGTYTVTASANGYFTETVPGVTVLAHQTTIQDFILQAERTYIVSGTVTEAGSGIPLYAHITFDGSPQEAWTDPYTGFYQAQLPAGQYTMFVVADLHSGESRTILLDKDQTQNFALESMRCILLVDDDQNAPDTRSYYTTALDAIGAQYDIWDTSIAGSPSPNNLTGYKQILWYLGQPFINTFTSDDESVVTGFLDAGGSFFLSGQDYIYDMGLTSFGINYLHIGSYSEDEIHTSVTGLNIFEGLGPYSLHYPFENYSDVVNPDGQSLLAFSGDMGDAAISYVGETFQTVFLAYSLEALEHVEDRATVLAHTLDLFASCSHSPVIVNPASIDLQVQPGQNITSSFELQNAFSVPLSYTISDALSVPWLTFSPQQGSLLPYASQTVSVIFDTAPLLPGVYTTTLEILTSGQTLATFNLSVKLTIPPTIFELHLPVVLKYENRYW